MVASPGCSGHYLLFERVLAEVVLPPALLVHYSAYSCLSFDFEFPAGSVGFAYVAGSAFAVDFVFVVDFAGFAYFACFVGSAGLVLASALLAEFDPVEPGSEVAAAPYFVVAPYSAVVVPYFVAADRCSAALAAASAVLAVAYSALVADFGNFASAAVHMGFEACNPAEVADYTAAGVVAGYTAVAVAVVHTADFEVDSAYSADVDSDLADSGFDLVDSGFAAGSAGDDHNSDYDGSGFVFDCYRNFGYSGFALSVPVEQEQTDSARLEPDSSG